MPAPLARAPSPDAAAAAAAAAKAEGEGKREGGQEVAWNLPPSPPIRSRLEPSPSVGLWEVEFVNGSLTPPCPQKTRVKTTRPEMPLRQHEGRPPFSKALWGKREGCLGTEFSRFPRLTALQAFLSALYSLSSDRQTQTKDTSGNTAPIVGGGVVGRGKRGCKYPFVPSATALF